MNLRDLQGLGPKSEQVLLDMGIRTVEQFLAANPFEIYRNLPTKNLNFLYAIIGAQQDIHWQTISRKQKLEILMRLDDMGLAPKK